MSIILRPDGRPLSVVAAAAAQESPVGNNPGQLRIPTIPIPGPLQDDLKVNPQLVPNFYEAVNKALTLSMQHPMTRPRVLSGELLKERAETCYGVLTILRRDMKWPLRKCFDVLPQQFMHALIRGTRAEDEATARAEGTAWNKGSEPQTVQVNKRAAQDEDDEEFTADTTEDMTDADE